MASLSAGGADLGTVRGQETAVRMLRDAGFTDVGIRTVDGDPLDLYDIATNG